MSLEYEQADHPLIVFSEQGKRIARINPDMSWSVQWDAVVDQAYAPATMRNVVLRGICRVLLAARDNFRTTPWETPYTWDAQAFFLSADHSTTGELIALYHDDLVIARFTSEEIWEVNWAQVECYRANSGRGAAFIALCGMCELLSGARDNFPAKTVFS